MLSLMHPEVLPDIAAFPGGLQVLRLQDSDRPVLIVKVPKEYILAAKINGGFRIYLTPARIDGQVAWGLVTAFFDDADEPLALRTPLLDEEWAAEVLDALRSDVVDVHFFDELARERLVYRASVKVPEATVQHIESIELLPFSIPRARALLDGIEAYFGLRTPTDEAEAIEVSFEEALFGEDLFIQDARMDLHAYHGARGFSHTMLEREEPGQYQEEDIIQCLQMIFLPQQIYLGPRRTYDGEELCDVLVVSDSRILVVQAKDSPNVEKISRQTLKRKRANVMSALRKAIEQVKGAVGYIRRNTGTLEFRINGELHTIALAGRRLKTLIVVKELFNDQFAEYSEPLRRLSTDKDVECVALDYPEFYSYCTHLGNEAGFFEAYDVVTDYAKQQGEYPRLRFGLVDE